MTRIKEEHARIFRGVKTFYPRFYFQDTCRRPGLHDGGLCPGQKGATDGGNSRKLILERLTPEQLHGFGQLEGNKANLFGLPPRPTDNHVLVRLLPQIDVETQEGIEAALRIVDALNPRAGRVKQTVNQARNDALEIPLEILRKIPLNVTISGDKSVPAHLHVPQGR